MWVRSLAKPGSEMDGLVPKLDIQSKRGETSISKIREGWQVGGIPASEWLFALLGGTFAD